jgi:hypothetical protein
VCDAVRSYQRLGCMVVHTPPYVFSVRAWTCGLRVIPDQNQQAPLLSAASSLFKSFVH